MKPFHKGIEAFKRGRIGNPYHPNTTDHRDWEHGFNKAYFSNLKKVKEDEQKRNELRGRG